MRPIKFRKWNSIQKTMDNDPTWEWVEGVKINWGFEHAQNSINIYMQFTGLLDKNGKEIYEGDIVQVSIGTKNYPHFVNKEIAYFEEYGIFGMKGHNTYAKHLPDSPYGKSGSSTTYTPYLLSKHWRRNMEVIGNIYENPELLSK